MYEIETEQLLLSPYTPNDAADMARLHCDPAIMRTMKGGQALSAEAARELFERYLHCWTRDDVGIFGVRLRETGEFIGECGFWFRGDRPGASMRYLLRPSHWGQGLGREMTVAVTQWLFTETDVMSFWAITQARNKGSVAILRRLGATLSNERYLDQDGLWQFDVTRMDWANAQKKYTQD